MGKKLFRHSQDVAMFSLDKSDKPLKLVGLKRWMVLGAFGIIILGILLWAIFGTILTTVKGTGILFNPENIYMVSSKVEGQVEQIPIYPYGDVRVGDLLMQIDSSMKELELKELEAQREGLSKISDGFDKSWEMVKIDAEIDMLKSYLKNQQVFAQKNGSILKIHKQIGQTVSPGVPLMTMEMEGGQPNLFFTFVPVAKGGGLIEKGMAAKISFSRQGTNRYGFLEGEVKDVRRLTFDVQEEINLIPSDLLKKYLADIGPAVLVKVALKTDPKTVSGYHWTTKMGPPFTIPTLAIGEAEITLEKKRPISFVIPHE